MHTRGHRSPRAPGLALENAFRAPAFLDVESKGLHLALAPHPRVCGEVCLTPPQDCDQRGSLCDAEKLRFDFAYPKPLTAEQLAAVQAQVNSQIGADLEVHTSTVALEQAMAINGLRAVFGQQCRTAHGADPALGSILRRYGTRRAVPRPCPRRLRGWAPAP